MSFLGAVSTLIIVLFSSICHCTIKIISLFIVNAFECCIAEIFEYNLNAFSPRQSFSLTASHGIKQNMYLKVLCAAGLGELDSSV